MSLLTQLNISTPIIQAPMAGVQDHQLAIAVAKGGALGSIPCAMLNNEQIVEQIQACKAVGIEQFNLNFFCHQPPIIDEHRQQQWSEKLAPYFQALNITEKRDSTNNRTPFCQATIDAIRPYAPPIISFHFGLPKVHLLEQLKAWGAIIISSATSLAEGVWLEQNGADIVIAQGLEAGGHRAMFIETDIALQQTTFSLVPQLVKRLNIPIIAAGGISDANGIRAAMALGASAVQIGTSYLLCDEAKTSDLHRQALTSNSQQQTCLTNVFTGRPARSIVNKAVKELGPMSTATPAFPLASISMSQLRNAAQAQGSADFMPLWSGQNASGCKAISATQLTEQLKQGLDTLC